MINKKILSKVIRNPKKCFRRGYQILKYKLNSDNHLEYDRKIKSEIIKEKDWREVTGPYYEGIGRWQFNFMRKRGLEPHHQMLDIGCGILRGGRFFIDYLKEDNYYGIDISAEILDIAKEVLEKEGLKNKNPILIQNNDMQFEEFDRKFDYILAQSVFTHQTPETVEECFKNINKVLKENGVFYATYNKSEEYRKALNQKDIAYPTKFFRDLGSKYDLEVKDIGSRARYIQEDFGEEVIKQLAGQRVLEIKGR